MSVATEFAPEVYLPPRARTAGQHGATVITLHPPAASTIAPPLRLTRRGVVALAGAVATLCAALVWLAALSAPTVAPGRPAVPATVTVRAGDTLWSLASRVAPNRDPRQEVAVLQSANRLRGTALVPGQVLRTR